ncbi:hypothetical protein H8D36_06545 [archaeon]|nr:hypothetical protein [archaeon]
MKKLLLVLIMLFVFSSFSYAALEDELAGCGSNVRCKFRIAEKYDSFDACDSISGALRDDCENLAVGEEAAVELRSERPEQIMTTGSNIPKSVSIGTTIGVLVFIVLIILLFIRYHHYKVFGKSHASLVKYVRNSLQKNKPEKEIVDKLKGVGWSDKVIDDAIKSAKHTKK